MPPPTALAEPEDRSVLPGTLMGQVAAGLMPVDIPELAGAQAARVQQEMVNQHQD